MATRKLKILIVAAEVAPFAKVGGLADVAGALPKALKAMGHDVRVVMPCYKMIETNPKYKVQDIITSFPVPIHDGCVETASLRQTSIEGDVPVYLIAHERYFTEATESKKVYSLEPQPYIFFSRAVTEFVPLLEPSWAPDVVHCNDWHTGLVPVFLETFCKESSTWNKTASVFTIHNLAYQGDYNYEFLKYAGLPDSLFSFDKLEFYGKVNFMKGGIIFSSLVNTVSDKYAEEIQTQEYGCSLEGLLQYTASQGRLSGIVNGIDYDEYNPETDTRIAANYSAANFAGKENCKAALQKESNLPVNKDIPIVGLISRLADQKGFDLIHEIAEKMLEMPVQFILLGTGDPYYEEFFRNLQVKYPQKVRANIGFDANLAQRIYAGCDMFLMPSRFEPCGLGQLMSLRYGTIPIVRSTGGLADTISDFNPKNGRGNGFAFVEYNSAKLLETIQRAIETFGDRSSWNKLRNTALQSDFSWNASAKKYVNLYRKGMK